MNRNELQERICPLTEYKLEKKKVYEESGKFYNEKNFDQWWQKDSSGYLIFSNEIMTNLPNVKTDPLHSTEFVSVNFVYSGQLIIDFLNNNLLHGLKGTGPVADFLIAAMTGCTNEFSYLISRFENNDRMRNLFEDIFCEYLEPGVISDVLVENYVRIFFAFLIRSSSNILNTNTKADLWAILSYIEEHYTDCSLSELSRVFHFNSKYLGNLIKKKTGSSFQQLLENARMRKICYYLENSELPVREIAQNCGYSNMTFFFRRFEERYQLTPAKYREFKNLKISDKNKTLENARTAQTLAYKTIENDGHR